FCLSRSGATGTARASAANTSHPGDSLNRPGVLATVVSATFSSGQRGKPRPTPFVKHPSIVLYVRARGQPPHGSTQRTQRPQRFSCPRRSPRSLRSSLKSFDHLHLAVLRRRLQVLRLVRHVRPPRPQLRID